MELKSTKQLIDRMRQAFNNSLSEKIKAMNTPKTNTFNLQNASAQDLRQMIESGNLPGFLSANQKERIQELYSQGKTFDSIRKLQGLIDGQNGKSGKTLL